MHLQNSASHEPTADCGHRPRSINDPRLHPFVQTASQGFPSSCNGIDIDSSCQEGSTCVTRVLEGEPDHRDILLTDVERRSGDRMLVCVSRSKSAKLVLEL